MTEHTAQAVYQILVNTAGAREDWSEEFVHHMAFSGTTEYRFQGDLGFGGKFWRPYGCWYVSCYSEDMNPERAHIIEHTNTLLAQLKEMIGASADDRYAP
jgi:hypothetical protein